MRLFVATTLTLALLVSSAVAGPPLRILFKNASSLTVSELYIEIVGNDGGSERLKGKVVPPKGETQVMLEDGVDKCVVDLKLKTVEGKQFSARARLCEDHTFTFRGRP